MKKLLLLGILVGLGSTVMAVGEPFINEGHANYGNPSYRIFENDNKDITKGDGEQKESLVRRFLKKGVYREDKKTMDIYLLVHHPVAILPEYNKIEGEGVFGDKLLFGDITFKVVGSMPVDVEIELKGEELFEMLTKATLKAPGTGKGIEEIAAIGTLEMDAIQLGVDGDVVVESQNIELDLYFDLDKVGKFDGEIVARASYE